MRIKLFRVAAELKQKDVAEALEVTVNFVSMVERGKREPTLRYLRAFAELANIPASVLLWEPQPTDEREPESQVLHSRLAALMAEYAASMNVRPVGEGR